MRAIALSIAVLLSCCRATLAQNAATLDRQAKADLRACTISLSNAQLAEDGAQVKRFSQQAIQLLGGQAGLPEVPDEFRSLPKNAQQLSLAEIPSAFDPYIELIKSRRWWRVGLDPTHTNHALREVANVIEGCLSARELGGANSNKLLDISTEAGEYLIWAQEQAGTGVIPFPAVRNGEGRPFEVAEQFFRRAELENRLDKVINQGWTVDDFDDGGLQFDNGLAGVALAHLYEATHDPRYLKSALRAADWAASRRVVTNWNYNSFSVLLLAEIYGTTGNAKYLNSAKKKAQLGVLPGQLTEGPRRGRWADPHNARPAYHYIMVQSLAALAKVMPKDDADLPSIVDSLRLALNARNPDFQKGIFNADSSVEALVGVKKLPQHLAHELADCETDQTLVILEKYFAAAFRAKKSSLGPAAWGKLLAYRKSEATAP